MPKRRQRLPYRVRYAWASGGTGAEARPNLSEAELLADQIESNARLRDREVTITISYVATPGGKGTVLSTRTITQE